jgi:hypothetical protein
MLSPVPPYVLVHMKKAMRKIVRTWPFTSNPWFRRWRWRSGLTHLYSVSKNEALTLKPVKLPSQLYPVHGVVVTVGARLHSYLPRVTSLTKLVSPEEDTFQKLIMWPRDPLQPSPRRWKGPCGGYPAVNRQYKDSRCQQLRFVWKTARAVTRESKQRF